MSKELPQPVELSIVHILVATSAQHQLKMAWQAVLPANRADRDQLLNQLQTERCGVFGIIAFGNTSCLSCLSSCTNALSQQRAAWPKQTQRTSTDLQSVPHPQVGLQDYLQRMQDAEAGWATRTSSASGSMDLDQTSDSDALDKTWTDLNIGSLKQDAARLDCLVKFLQDNGHHFCPCCRKIQPLALLYPKPSTSGTESRYANSSASKNTEVQRDCHRPARGTQPQTQRGDGEDRKAHTKKTSLQEKRKAVRKDVANETISDGSDPAQEVKLALKNACQDLRAAVSVPDNSQGQQDDESRGRRLGRSGSQDCPAARSPCGAIRF